MIRPCTGQRNRLRDRGGNRDNAIGDDAGPWRIRLADRNFERAPRVTIPALPDNLEAALGSRSRLPTVIR